MRGSFFTLAAIAAMVGCSSPGTDVVERVGSNDLGITQVEISRSMQDGEPLLLVRGVDDAGNELATATLRIGLVSYTPDPGVVPAEWTTGTELTLSVGDETLPMVTPDLRPHGKPMPFIRSIASFVALPPVTAAIAEAGIWFTPTAEPGAEEAYTAGGCYSSLFPYTQPVTQCCQDDNWTFHKSTNFLVVRSYLAAGPNPPRCRLSDGTTGCGWWEGQFYGQCAFGPCGGANYVNGGNASATVFVPDSQPTWCGLDWDGTGAGGGDPEPYVGQGTYPGVTASCYQTVCCADGTATTDPSTCVAPPTCGGTGSSCTTDEECCGGSCWEGYTCYP